MLSSKDGVFDKARGRMVGSEDYLTKPFTKEQLLRAVAQYHPARLSTEQSKIPARNFRPLRAAGETGQKRTPGAFQGHTMPIQHILLVDDSKTEVAYLSDLLAKRGFTVRTAENGEDAMKRLAEGKPDLILMDVVMPGTNGYQLTRSITRDPRYSDVPVIMCTSKGQETDRVWGMRQGARDYVVKPVDTDDLMAKIKSLG